MLKYVYKILILFGVFVGSLYLMGRNIKEVKVDLDTTIEMKEATFPIITLKSSKETINLLHGYGGSIDSKIVRESITPVDKSKTFSVQVKENESTIKKIKYEIRQSKDGKIIDYGSISALTEWEQGKMADIKIQALLESSQEYLMKITLVTDVSRKINYYSRIKYYEEDCYLQEKLDFVRNFQKNSFNKKKAETLKKYLEPDYSLDNTSFAKVSIHSSFDLLSWGNLKPKVLTEITPTVREFNIETASIVLDYFVSVETDSGKEIYRVREFYRVRYTTDRIFLLKYDRTMEAQFNIQLASVNLSQFKIGISSETNLPIKVSEDQKQMCFERGGALWIYNVKKNLATQVFSFQQKDTDYMRDTYDQHDIRVLNMDNEGNMDFMVYGYMNRGDYEGRVAILLYKYYAKESRIKEQVYIPLETTYQRLKEDLNEFSYVSQKNIFYFTVNDVIYAYNMLARKAKVIAKNVIPENLLTLDKNHAIAWVDEKNAKKAKVITILNLETEETQIIKAPKGDNIRILGEINSKLVFGYVHQEDISETTYGSQIVPVYRLEIADVSGNILKTYKKNNTYIIDIIVENNIIRMKRVRKSDNNGEGYEAKEDDSILSHSGSATELVSVTNRVTELTLSELYISLPVGFTMQEKPKVKVALNTIITEDTTFRLKEKEETILKYYVDAGGSIIGSYDSPEKAIIKADQEMGVVLNNRYEIIWERGNRFNRNTIAGIHPISSGGGRASVGACLSMVLKYNQITKNPGEIAQSGKSILKVLQDNLDYPLNLTGCTLDQILYFISNQRPVIAMKGSGNAILITGYDEYYVTIMDPSIGRTQRLSMKSAQSMLEKAGNIFITYVN